MPSRRKPPTRKDPVTGDAIRIDPRLQTYTVDESGNHVSKEVTTPHSRMKEGKPSAIQNKADAHQWRIEQARQLIEEAGLEIDERGPDA